VRKNKEADGRERYSQREKSEEKVEWRDQNKICQIVHEAKTCKGRKDYRKGEAGGDQ